MRHPVYLDCTVIQLVCNYHLALAARGIFVHLALLPRLRLHTSVQQAHFVLLVQPLLRIALKGSLVPQLDWVLRLMHALLATIALQVRPRKFRLPVQQVDFALLALLFRRFALFPSIAPPLACRIRCLVRVARFAIPLASVQFLVVAEPRFSVQRAQARLKCNTALLARTAQQDRPRLFHVQVACGVVIADLQHQLEFVLVVCFAHPDQFRLILSQQQSPLNFQRKLNRWARFAKSDSIARAIAVPRFRVLLVQFVRQPICLFINCARPACTVSPKVCR